MDKKIKLLIIIGLSAVLLAIIYLGLQNYAAKKALEQERDALKSENTVLSRKINEISEERRQLLGKVNALNDDLSKASAERDDVQRRYEMIVRDRDGLVEKVKALQDSSEKMRTELAALAREKEALGKDIENNLAPLKDENNKLKQEMDDLKSAKGKLESELWQLIGEKSSFADKINQIDSFLQQRLSKAEYAALKAQIDGILGTRKSAVQSAQPPEPPKESVELPPIVVRPKGEAETPLSQSAKTNKSVSLTGTILEVNKENGFVIIDLGQEAGIKMGESFRVYKQGRPVASLEVIQVRQNISACDITDEIMPVEVGDIVR